MLGKMKNFPLLQSKALYQSPLSHLNQASDLEFIQKESLSKEIFTICKSGKRSDKASIILSKFKIQSKSIEGGIEKLKHILLN